MCLCGVVLSVKGTYYKRLQMESEIRHNGCFFGGLDILIRYENILLQ